MAEEPQELRRSAWVPSTRFESPLRVTARATRLEPSDSRAGGRPWSHPARCNTRHTPFAIRRLVGGATTASMGGLSRAAYW